MLQALQNGQGTAATGTGLFQLSISGCGRRKSQPAVKAAKGALQREPPYDRRTLWSFRCKERLLCCSTRHGRLIRASVHRHAVQYVFELSQAWRLHARLNSIALQAASRQPRRLITHSFDSDTTKPPTLLRCGRLTQPESRARESTLVT